MKMKLKKILIITITIFIALSAMISTNATTITGKDVTGTFGGNANPTGSAPIRQIINTVLGLIRVAGAGVAVVMLLTIAAKYIMASAGDRADIKKYAVNYCIGAIVLLGASGILGIVSKFVENSLTYK